MSNAQAASKTQLAKYDAACRAVAECKSVDEAKDIHHKAVAMAVYARQAKNKTLEADAKAIRMRALRKLDGLRRVQKKTMGLAKGGGGKHGRKRVTEKPTLASQGIDKNLAHRGRVLGAMSDEKFEEAVADARLATTAPKLRKNATAKSFSQIADINVLHAAWNAADRAQRKAFVNAIGLVELFVQASHEQQAKLADMMHEMDRKAKIDGAAISIESAMAAH
jgi:hypothetical protein